MKLTKIRKRYSEQITMHGVPLILHGTRVEQVIWSILLASTLVCVWLLTQTMITEFYSQKINTRNILDNKWSLALPTLLVCPHYFGSMSNTPCGNQSNRPLPPENLFGQNNNSFCVNDKFVVATTMLKGNAPTGRNMDRHIQFHDNDCFSFNLNGEYEQK